MKFIVEHWDIIYGPILAFLAFWGGKKMKKAETQIKQGDAMASMQKSYDEWVMDANEKIADLKADLKQVNEMVHLLQKDKLQQSQEMREIRKANSDLKEKNEQALAHIKSWEVKYNSLKRSFEELKKKYNDKINQTPSDGN